MFKFVVVCALIGAAVAEPGALFGSYAYPGAVVASAPAYIPSAYGNVVYNSPLVQPAAISYSSPLAHLIKKRSAPLIWPSAYSAISPLATGYAATGPLYTPTIGAASYISSPYYSSLPLAYGAPLIKK